MAKIINNPSCSLAIDITVQTTKLLIALATSIIAFTVAMDGKRALYPMKISWIILALSVVAGIFVLQKIIGELAYKEQVFLYDTSIKIACMVQCITFVIGVFIVAFFLLFD